MSRSKMRRCKKNKCRTLTLNPEFCDAHQREADPAARAAAEAALFGAPRRADLRRLRDQLEQLKED